MLLAGAFRSAGLTLRLERLRPLPPVFLIRARRPRFDARALARLHPQRAGGPAACPTGFAASAGARLARERRALLRMVDQSRVGPGRLTAARRLAA